MDLFDIKCFLSVAQHLNLSLAAKEMFISQPAMSVKINAIEEEFDVKLFNRSRHKVELTPAGKLVQKSLADMLDNYEEIKAEACKIGSNHLSIGWPMEWINVDKVIQSFHTQYPDIELDVKLGGWGQLTSEVINGSLDVSFTEQSEILDIPALEGVFLFRDYGAIAVSKSSFLTKYIKIKPDLLKNEKIIMCDDKNGVKTMRQIHKRLNDAGFDMKNAKLAPHYSVTIAMASIGLGVAPILRSLKVKDNPSVSYVDIDSDKLFADFVLTWSLMNENPFISLFKDFCMQQKWGNVNSVVF